MKIKIKDGLGRRICTEVRRPDPQAVLVMEEGVEYEVTNEELHTLLACGYFELKNVQVNDQIAKAVYPDTIVYEKKEEKPVVKQAPQGVAAAKVAMKG